MLLSLLASELSTQVSDLDVYHFGVS